MKRRANGSGTLIKKPNGTYIGKWTFRGKTYFKAIHETTEFKARKVLDKLTKPYTEQSDIDALMHIEATVKASILKKDKHYLEEHDIKLKEIEEGYFSTIYTSEYDQLTKDVQGRILKRFADWSLKKYPSIDTVSKVDDGIALEYVTHINKSFAPSTYNGHISTLKRCWKVLSKDGTLFRNVWKEYKAKKKDIGSHRRELTTAEIVKLMECCRTDEQRLMFLLGIYTGMRVGDCANIKWNQVDLEQNVLWIVPHKTRKYHSTPIRIPIHPILLKGLKAALTWKTEDDEDCYIMPDMQSRYERRTITCMFEKIFAKAKIKTTEKDEHGVRRIVAGFHSLRRTFVSVNVNSGMNPFLIQKIVGHSDIDMTAYYYEVNKDLMRRGIDKMPDYTRPKKNAPVIDIEINEEKKKSTDELDIMFDAMFGDDGKPLSAEEQMKNLKALGVWDDDDVD